MDADQWGVFIMINWTSEKRNIKELIPAEYNPRLLTDKQRKDLDQSLSRFNLADPIPGNLISLY